MTSKILLFSETNNKTITMIINKFEEEITVLISEIVCYELVKLKYNRYEYYNELLNNYLSKTQEYTTDTDKFAECQRIIKYLSSVCIEINNNNSTDFGKIREIRKKQEMIETIKKIGNYEHIDDILEVIKNLS